MDIDRTVVTPTSRATAFAYLADFTNTEEWDPGTVRTRLVIGDGGVGTRYANTSKFLGRSIDLEYLVTEYVPNERIVLQARTGSVTTTDTMEFADEGTGPDAGCRVRYHAQFDFKGLIRFVAPLSAPAFKRLGDEAERKLQTVLDRLDKPAA